MHCAPPSTERLRCGHLPSSHRRTGRDQVDQQRIVALNDWLAGHHGVVSRQVLMGLGFDDGAVGRLVRGGRLDRIARGAYCTPTVPLGRLQLMVAACLLAPAAAIGFTTAGQEWRFRGMTDPRVHVLLPHHLTLHIEGVVVHRCRRIDPVDLVAARPDGVRLTSPPRTLFDSAAIVGHDATESAVEQALMERRCTVPTPHEHDAASAARQPARVGGVRGCPARPTAVAAGRPLRARASSPGRDRRRGPPPCRGEPADGGRRGAGRDRPGVAAVATRGRGRPPVLARRPA